MFVAVAAWLWPEPLHVNPITETETPLSVELPKIDETITPKLPGKTRILIAKFDGAEESKYRVTDVITSKLRDATSSFPDTEIISINQVVTEAQGSKFAIALGETYKANMVIWGWYGVTETSVPLGVHLEVLYEQDPENAYLYCPASREKFRKSNVSSLNDLTLQINLSDELSSLVTFTIGLSRYQVGDMQSAVSFFDKSLMLLSAGTQIDARSSSTDELLVNREIIYLYRANANASLGNYDNALSDYAKLPKNLSLQLATAGVLVKSGDPQSALEYLNPIVNSGSANGSALAYYYAAVAYFELREYNKADENFNKSIQINEVDVLNEVFIGNTPKNLITKYSELIAQNDSISFLYYIRGLAYSDLEENDLALQDLNKALEKNPNILGAYYRRASVLLAKKEYSAGIKDYTHSFSSEIYNTPCAYLKRGGAYQKKLELFHASEDYRQAIRLATTEIEADPNNSNALLVRGQAYLHLFNPFFAVKDILVLKEIDPIMFDEYEGNSLIFRSVVAMILMVALPFLLFSPLKDFYVWVGKKLKQQYKKRRH